jgi:hypothetical protein
MRRVGWVMFGVGLWTVLIALSVNAVGSVDLRPPAAVCAEDDACWDCSTMGNGVCGPKGGR